MPEHQQIKQSKGTQPPSQRRIIPSNQSFVSNPTAIIQRARIDPKSLTSADVLQLQRTIGNRAVGRLLSEIRNPSTIQKVPIQRQKLEEETCHSCVQRQEVPEEEEPLQGKMTETVQRQEIPEEEEPVQGMFKGKPQEETCFSCMQRQEIPGEDEHVQGKMMRTVQRQEIPEEEEPLQTKKENNTGMPDNLKAGVESLSGIDISDVRVHYNSSKPAEVGALAYTQGTNIHIAPRQERHLPHEAWHVVQQARGRVRPMIQLKDVAVNDDEELEREADVMGLEAANQQKYDNLLPKKLYSSSLVKLANSSNIIQGFKLRTEFEYRGVKISGLDLVSMLDSVAQVSHSLQFMKSFLQASGVSGTDTVEIGKQKLTLGENYYVGLFDKKLQTTTFGSVAHTGPSYPEMKEPVLSEITRKYTTLTPVEYHKFGTVYRKLGGEPRVAALMRDVLLSENPSEIHLEPAIANFLGAIGGAETLRNPRSFVTLLMFLDRVIGHGSSLVDEPEPLFKEPEDQPTFATGMGVGTEDTKTGAGGKVTKGIDVTLEFFGLPVEGEKSAKIKRLQEYLANLDLDQALKEKIMKSYDVNPNIWGGILPMIASNSVNLGSEPIPKPGEKKGMNIVQVKEATMIINWLEFRIRDMKQEERAEFDKNFQLNPREEILKMIKNLVDGSPTTSILNSPSLPPDLGVVPAKLSLPHLSLDNL
ncbi:DUF4157 domain-containing protein [Methanosarcina sp.]|uniref:eCIS core domain-containing protein n=1 Tax=Methanosarcina sp. TaxID=2213 RepID=UPI003C73D2DD